MGWMTWQRFRCQVDCKAYPRDCISEDLIKRTADRLVQDGFLDAGYEYVVIDDCWSMRSRDEKTSKLLPDPDRFPSGLKNLSDHLHKQNLKFGMYLDYGKFTCQHYPGSMDHLELDAATVAEYGADYVKMDGCYSPVETMPGAYEKFVHLLNDTGRPMVFSCSYPAYIQWQHNYSLIDWERLKRNCNLWRMLDDVEDKWSSVKGIIENYRQHSQLLEPLAGPGHWNDADMLVLGNFGLSHDQERVQMGMWCMFASPLLLSTDMDDLNSESAKLIKNKMLIDIDQDEGGQQAKFVGMKGDVQTIAMNAFCLLIGLLVAVRALDNGLARKPPMGWMTWQRFRCQVDCKAYPRDCISEDLIKRTADRLVQDGFLDAGYEYVVIDDCWQMPFRDRHTSKLVPDPDRFPTGLNALGDYLHERKLKFGIYVDYGKFTCEHYPGSMDYLDLDAKTVAEFGVDYVKMDGCYAQYQQMPAGFQEFSRHLNSTGRPMVFSCEYPVYTPWLENTSLIDWERLQRVCNSWRIYWDVEDQWDRVMTIINVVRQHSELLSSIAGPGHWNDPDMLVLGNFGLSHDQERVQMGMWCMFAAPLLISTDMDELNEKSANLMKNKMLIDIDQDEGGHQAKFVGMKGDVQLWTRQLTRIPNSWAIALLNAKQSGAPIHVPVTLEEMNITSNHPESDAFELIDVFTESEFGVLLQKESIVMRLNPNGIVMYRVQLRPT
ncbi:Alpha-N-acetylgalactosaminidase [Fasciola gigantica]|uniref:Alpha-galactosidase n=1 Tax=Fasciola gigantica TaxID=46835 RepID=A0A504YXB0_FASGI|nr:Alpha-N-acetylgalactosaminidase [Fasciola gigantica]